MQTLQPTIIIQLILHPRQYKNENHYGGMSLLDLREESVIE